MDFPPSTAHILQASAFRCYFFSPLKAAYRRECDQFLKSGNLIHTHTHTPNHVAEIFNKTCSRVATSYKTTNGFVITGIHPLNDGIFEDENFLAKTIYHKTPELS